MQLKRNISKTSLLFLSIGSIVGSGWLFGSFYTAQLAGPAAIIAWVLGGLFVAIIALTFAELSTMLPLSGGSIAYSLMSHGKMAGAIFGWITWLWTMVVVPIEVQAVMQYASNYIPNVTERVNNAEELTTKGLLLATVLMALLSIINVIGVKIMAETNKMVVIWKLIIPVAVAYLLLTTKIHPENLTSQGFAPFGFNGILSGIAIGGVSFSFFGFQTAIFLAGEAKNPQKSIPFALFGSILACMILYAVLQLGFILSLDPKSIENGWQQINFTGDAGPFAGIFVGLGLAFMVKVLYFDAVLSPLGTAVGFVASSSRILYSMSLQNDAPKALAKVNRYSIPWLAILANFVLGMLFFLPFSGWQSMVAFLSAAIVVSLACGPICLPIFRKKFPNIPRPFNLPYANFISFVAFYICNLLLQWTGWSTVWKLQFAVALGVLIFLGSYFFSNGLKKEKLHIKSFSWIVLYLALSTLTSYLGTFGGGVGIISMQMDFIVILITSAIIFMTAQKTALSDEESNILYDKLISEHLKNKIS
ncbi:APC family permease [Fluviispira multicolorata]|uniref:Amino acid permease n=1 Tax=Fluviispira multicolorata TaxID=2654512 RepID=A0A833JDB3_9BACT|nr:APC family permease [Fluviispira multicolorata]KAB8030840.1 amino acid permease [Fluviispira multicolorata]